MLIKKPPNISIKTLFLPWSVNLPQKCIDIKKKFGGGWYEKGIAEFGKGNKTSALKYFDEANKYRDWRKLAQRKIDEINNPTKYEK